MALSYVSTESRELPRGRAFHNLGAATWNDLSPSVALVLNVGDASKIPPDDLRLYAPCDFKPLCNIKFPFQVCETAHSTHFKEYNFGSKSETAKLYENWKHGYDWSYSFNNEFSGTGIRYSLKTREVSYRQFLFYYCTTWSKPTTSFAGIRRQLELGDTAVRTRPRLEWSIQPKAQLRRSQARQLRRNSTKI